MSPKGENWKKALKFWKTLYSDKDCKFDKEINIEGKDIEPLLLGELLLKMYLQ